MFGTTVTVTEPIFFSPFYNVTAPTGGLTTTGWATQYGGTTSWTYTLPPGALTTEEVKIPAKPRKKTSEWRKKRKNAKARNRWEKEIEQGRKLIMDVVLDLFNGFKPLTVIIADYTLVSSKPGFAIAFKKCESSKLPRLALQEIPRCHNWKRKDHSPLTDEICYYCKGCRHFYCDKCLSDISDQGGIHAETRIPLSSIGVVIECDLCDRLPGLD